MTRLFVQYTDNSDENVVNGVKVPHVERLSWTLDEFKHLPHQPRSNVNSHSECNPDSDPNSSDSDSRVTYEHLEDAMLQIDCVVPSHQSNIVSVDIPDIPESQKFFNSSQSLPSKMSNKFLYLVVIEESGGGQSYHCIHYLFFEFSQLDAYKQVMSYFDEEHNRDNECKLCENKSKQCKRNICKELNQHKRCVMETSDHEEPMATIYKIPLPPPIPQPLPTPITKPQPLPLSPLTQHHS